MVLCVGPGEGLSSSIVKDECKPFTAFVTPWGLHELNRSPFGLTGAPGTFQRFVNDVLGDFRDNFCIPYIDDIIVYSDSFTNHLQHLRAIPRLLKEKGLKLKPRKCELFQKSVRYLGCRESR